MKTIYKPKRCNECIRTAPISHKICNDCTIKTQNPYTFKGFQLSSAKNSEGHYKEILEGIYALLIYMTQRFNTVFVVNMIVKYPLGFIHEHDLSTLARAERCGENNDLFLDFLENFSDHCRARRYHPKYAWCRERSLQTGGFHFHVLYCFDSRYIQNGYNLLPKAKKLWGNCLKVDDPKGLVRLWVPKPKVNIRNQDNEMDIEDLYRYGGLKLRRSDAEFNDKFALVFKYASYLAKVYSKGYSPYHVNEFDKSNLN